MEYSSPNINMLELIQSKLVPIVLLNKIDMNVYASKTCTEKVVCNNTLDSSSDDIKGTTKNGDVYEFLYDPSEEPAPSKKHKLVKKRVSKPKRIIVKNNYDVTLSKTLANLKQKVITKTLQDLSVTSKEKLKMSNMMCNEFPTKVDAENNQKNDHLGRFNLKCSPLTTPRRTRTVLNEVRSKYSGSPKKNVPQAQIESIFFDEPDTNNKCSEKVKNPLASPWRVEFHKLPIKWQANINIKSNMTPAFESSFINPEPNKGKHVYTNLLQQNNETFDEIMETNTPKLKQTSLISFIEEVEKKSGQMKLGRSSTPKRDLSGNQVSSKKLSKKLDAPNKLIKNMLCNSFKEMTDNYKENSKEISENAMRNKPMMLRKTLCFKKIDQSSVVDSDNLQQNVVLSGMRCKEIENSINSRSRSGRVLQEKNDQFELSLADLPIANKPTKHLPSIDTLNKTFDDLKADSNSSNLFEKETEAKSMPVCISDNPKNDDSSSVHLFEDVEMIHHVKPVRKSYGKFNKTNFSKNLLLDSDNGDDKVIQRDDCEEDSFYDSLLEMTELTKNKPTKKKDYKYTLTKKEEQEAETWAASFNSMCEDVEEFDLIVE